MSYLDDNLLHKLYFPPFATTGEGSYFTLQLNDWVACLGPIRRRSVVIERDGWWQKVKLSTTGSLSLFLPSSFQVFFCCSEQRPR